MPQDLKKWTVMVYLAGQNNLAEECVFSLNEMKRAATEAHRARLAAAAANKGQAESDKSLDDIIRVAAQLDATGLGGNEQRYVLTKDNWERAPSDEDGVLKNHVVTTRNTGETSYRQVLKDFLATSIQFGGRAEKYAVILSGHGSGADGDFLSKQADPPDTLSIPKLQWVFSELRKDLAEIFSKDDFNDFQVDLLGIDSCLMSMAEVCFELRHYVKFLVGAEGFEANAGWPYERVLTTLFENQEIEAERFARTIVEKYITFYSDYIPAGRFVDLAACRLDKCDDLAAAVKKLADVMTVELDNDDGRRAILLAHWEAQTYKDDRYVDLYDFCDLLDCGPAETDEKPQGTLRTGSVMLRGAEVSDALRKACRAVKNVLRDPQATSQDPKNSMVLKSCYSGPAVQYSHGLSVYFPWSRVSDQYSALEFAQATGWHEFLQQYVEKTRRLPRECPSKDALPLQRSMLVFRPSLLGVGFLPLNDRTDITDGRIIFGNKVGSMKNPATSYYECPCAETGQDDAGVDGSAGDQSIPDTAAGAVKRAGSKQKSKKR